MTGLFMNGISCWDIRRKLGVEDMATVPLNSEASTLGNLAPHP